MLGLLALVTASLSTDTGVIFDALQLPYQLKLLPHTPSPRMGTYVSSAPQRDLRLPSGPSWIVQHFPYT